jgi:hypothetical protein
MILLQVKELMLASSPRAVLFIALVVRILRLGILMAEKNSLQKFYRKLSKLYMPMGFKEI